MCGSDSTNSLTLELNLFSSIKLFIYCSEQTTCRILIRHVVVVLSDSLSLVSPALWRQWLGGWLAESDVTFTLALQIISTVLWCPGSSSLSFPLRYTGCLHLIVVVTLPWSCLGKHKNWMDVGWGHQPAPARAGPVQHHSGHAAGNSEATWARDQHVATIASFQHSAGHQLVLGGLFPTLYFIGAASVATPVPPPAHHPSPRPVPGGTCWLQNPRSGRCNTRYTASVSTALMLLQTTVSYKV